MGLNVNGYYHPSEISYLFNDSQEELFDNITMREWLEYYIDVCNDSIQPNIDIEKERYTILKTLYEQPYINYDKIMSLGFNPNLEFNDDSILLQTTRLKDIFENKINNYNSKELLIESVKNNLNNIYILLSRTNSRTSNLINKVTGDEYTHSSFSFDNKFDNMYSFNSKGFVTESLDEFKNKFGDINIAIFSASISNNKYMKIKARIMEYVSKRNKMHYSTLGLIGVLLNKPIIFDNFKFCSEFVDELLKLADIDILNKPSGLTRPQDFKNNKILKKIFEGKISDYTNKKIKEKVDLLNEYKTSVEFNNKGDLVIKNIHKLDINDEYQKSHKLLLSYDKSKNYEGMKYEIAKLWYLNYKIESEINNNINSDKKELISLRARILNDFNKYLRKINSHDKKFNFAKYYKYSEFNEDNITINKNTIFNTIDLAKKIII